MHSNSRSGYCKFKNKTQVTCYFLLFFFFFIHLYTGALSFPIRGPVYF